MRATIVLGAVTIGGFGAWFYGYGVLLEPIRQDTGWSEAVLTTTYGVSLFGVGILATFVGRLLHRRGSRSVYAAGALSVFVAYLAVAAAPNQYAFAAAALVAGSITGGLGHYAAVHTVIAQLVSPDQRAKAITTNTLWGAFASPVFLPLMAWMVTSFDWRTTVRMVGTTTAVLFLAVAIVVPDSRGAEGITPSIRAALAAAGRDRTTRALLATTFAGGLVASLLFLYQVPVMVASGLTLGVASALAGARGLLQLAGRIPMPWIIRTFGSRNGLRIAHVLIGVSCLILPFSGFVPMALAFAVVAGVAIGALVPVESIFSADAVPGNALGIILGVSSLTRGVGSVIGPAVGGSLTAAFGSRTPALVMVAIVSFVAAGLVPAIEPGRRPER